MDYNELTDLRPVVADLWPCVPSLPAGPVYKCHTHLRPLRLSSCFLSPVIERCSPDSTHCLSLLSPYFREVSADLLQMIPDNYTLLAKMCAFYPGSAAEINQLHERVSRRL